MMQNYYYTENIKSLWTTPLDNETEAPEKRIIHSKFISFKVMPRELKINLKLGLGYMKCGSEINNDWISDVYIYSYTNNDWQLEKKFIGLKKPDKPLSLCMSTMAMNYRIEVRKSGVDGYWPCFNVCKTCIDIQAEFDNKIIQPIRKLHTIKYLSSIIDGNDSIKINKTSTNIFYQTKYYKIGFRTRTCGLSYLSLDMTGKSKTYTNLLKLASIKEEDRYTHQGLLMEVLGQENISDLTKYDITGITEIDNDKFKYILLNKESVFNCELEFVMLPKSIKVNIYRDTKKEIKLLNSAILRVVFNANIVPITALGNTLKKGETGHMDMPALLHFPGIGELKINGERGMIKYDSVRPSCVNTIDIKMGEILTDDGCYILEKGEYKSTLDIDIGFFNAVKTKEDTPEIVKEAINRYINTSLPYRADTNIFSNNGNSMGAPICLDVWSALCKQIQKLETGKDCFDFLESTITQQLLGSPGYGSGMHSSGEYLYEDLYLASGTNVLFGNAVYLEERGTQEYFDKYFGYIKIKTEELRQRDVDDDGLIESVYRKGISGEYQWSTCWYDVISFGYKDAFSNAHLYHALTILIRVLPKYGEQGYANELTKWADQIKRNYIKEFMTDNGWLAGWKCANNKLHDFGFLFVNGLAVNVGLLEGEQAKQAISKLYKELISSGFDMFDMGLPGNVFPIDNDDMAIYQHTLPFGGYQNAGVTLSQAGFFTKAMYNVGMKKEADYMLIEYCKGMLTQNIMGGVGSGGDWRTWDGISSGYEGILCDQLGVFEVILDRFGQ